MNRTLTTERLYSLGDFKNIKFIDTISDVPEEFVLDSALSNIIRYLQLVDIELAFRRYYQLAEKVGTLKVEETISILENLRQETLLNLKERLTIEVQNKQNQ